jgi:hypothetical protein
MAVDRAKIARTNKRKSREQERRLAKYFGGNVVPLSGSGNIKGDIIIPFDDTRNIYGECKMTIKDTLSVEHAWLAKIRGEYKGMRCMFGVLIVSFEKPIQDFVLISPEGLTILEKHGIIPVYSFKALADNKTFPIERNAINAYFIVSDNAPWLLVPLKIFKDWLDSIAAQSQTE